MKLFLNIIIIFLLTTFNINSYAETLENLVSEIEEIRKEISNLDQSSTVEAIKIDKSLKELNKVLDFVEESTKDQVTVISMKAENNAFVYRRNEDTKITQFKKLLEQDNVIIDV